MRLDFIQTSFASGEIGPSLYGRTDIVQYANACEIVENMLPRPYGSAISMPGTRYVATVSDSTLRTRLIPFIFNREDSYVIEMGDRYMRFFTDRGQVVSASGTEDLTSYGGNLIAHYKMNDNTNSTTVIDTVGSHAGSATTLTSSLSTTAIVSTGFDLQGRYHVSVADHINFTRTATTQPMTIASWVYYANNGSDQAICSKTGEYELTVNSSNELAFAVSSGSADTKLLLHFDGSDTSTTFTDSSASGHTPTASGNAQLDTAQQKFGTASGLFDGTGDYLTIPDSTDFAYGTADFTIDFWVRFNSTAGQQTWFDKQYSSAGGILLQWSAAAGEVQCYISNTLVLNRTWSPSTNTWYHIALSREGTSLRLFIDGVQQGAAVTNSTNLGTVGDLTIARNTVDGGFEFNGWMDELRIIKGTAAFTTGFTPSASAYQSAATNSWTVDSDISQGWHFIAVVFKGTGTSSSDCKIYVDGAIQTTTFSSDPGYTKMENTAALFRIGATSAAGADNWSEKLDNLAFLHQELTAAQIAAMYTTAVYQISTVFTESEVSDVHFTQLNDTVWLTHPNHPPQKLIRTSASEWSIADFDYIGGPFLDDNTAVTTITASATTGTVNLTVTPTSTSLFTVSGSSLGHHGAYWMIGGLAQTNTTTGLQEYGYVQITHVINGYTATATVIKNLKVSSATAVWAEGAWSAVRGYPARVTFQEKRLWFASTSYQPEHEWASKNFVFEDFSLGTQAADDALNLHLASNQSNSIQWLSSGKSLIAGTFGGAFVTNSGSTAPITPDNVNASEEVGFGSSDIMPKKIGSFLYYVQRFKKKLREMFYNWELDTYRATDKTILSPHILGNGVVEMDVQTNPETILYCVLTNGTLATMTREVDQEVTAWARHTTNGTYTSIAVIPSQSADYDEAWVICERWIQGNPRKYVEFFENIDVPTQQYDCLYLHSALTYNAYESTTSSNATISLSASSGSVTLTASTAYFNGGMINKRLRAIDEDGDTIGEGTITATASTTSITLSITTTFNALAYPAGRWGVSVSTVSGLDHLQWKTVGILADGTTESLTRTVASGAITLGSNYFVVSVGLSYDQAIGLLVKEVQTNRGTAQGKMQRINEIAFKVNRSTQGFRYGPDEDNLDDINLSFTPTVTSLYTGVLPPEGGGITMRGGYKRGAKVYIKNSNPLPLELLSIMGSLETNEK